MPCPMAQDQEGTPIVPNTQIGQAKISSRHADDHEEDGEYQKDGISLPVAIAFLVAGIGGMGLPTLPKAVENAGWLGILFLVITVLILAYTGKILARTWTLIRQRYPEYQGHVGYPYAAIGQVTFGRGGRWSVSAALCISAYSVFIVIILLVTDNLGNLLLGVGYDLQFIYRLLIVATVMLPILWMGRPRDFWVVGIGAAVFLALVSFLLFFDIVHNGLRSNKETVRHTIPTFQSITMSLGTIMSTFGAHPTFPTIQTDMANDIRFHWAVVGTILGVAALFGPITVASYFVYGIDTQASILANVAHGPMMYAVQILMTVHFLMDFSIIINPVSQEIEHLLNIPTEFNWKRCVSRTAMMASAVLVAVLIPNFGLVTAFTGGSSIALLSVIFPVLFSYKLCSIGEQQDEIKLSLWTKMTYIFIFIFGVVAGILCTYSAIYTLVSTDDGICSNCTESVNPH